MSKIFEQGAEKCTTEELNKIVEDTYDEWDKRGTIFSLSDFEEAIRELTLRENE